MAAPRERGETLTGLLVGLALGLVVLTGGSAMLSNQLRSHRQALQDTHLHHDLRSSVDWMAKELRKAQYTSQAWATRSPTGCFDAFCQDHQGFNLQGDEIVFSYDRNHNGVRDEDECTGFRLSAQAIQIKRSCQDGGNWQAITDTSSLKIRALQWSLRCQRIQGWLQRSVRMSLRAEWPDQPARQISLSQTVALQNDLPGIVHALYCP